MGADVVPDLLEVMVPVGGRVLVFGGLHLASATQSSSEQVVAEVARAIGAATGPGVVVVAGDLFDLALGTQTEVEGALRAYPRLRDALAAYAAGPGRSVVVLPGSQDACLAWSDRARRIVEAQLGARVSLSVDLLVATGAGERRVRVEPGHQLDPAHAFTDPRNGGESPVGQHLAREIFPVVDRAGAGWLAGVERLADPLEVGAFIRSRLLYRRIVRRAALFFAPFVVAALAALVGSATGGPGLGVWGRAAVIGLATGGLGLFGVVVGGAWWGWAIHRPLAGVRRGVAAAVGGGTPRTGAALTDHVDRNGAPRTRAAELVGDGWSGFVSGHTELPELVDLAGGFYANIGCGGEVVERRVGRGGLPDVYAVGRRLSWLELAAGPDLSAQLRWGRQALPSTTGLERLLSHPVATGTPRPSVVASWPDGADWPELGDDGVARRSRVRRQVAALLLLCGLVDLVSAITGPFRQNLDVLANVLPIEVPQVASVLVVLAGISLLLLGRGVRRGQRHAWALAMVVLSASAVLHLVKGLDVAEAAVTISATLYLAANRRHFRARIDEQSARRGLLTLLVGGLVAMGAGLVAVLTLSGDARPPFGSAVLAVAERLVGVSTIALPSRADHFLRPTLLATSIGLAVAAGWLLFRPVLARSLDDRPPEAIEHARRIVERSAGDTLAYFALRDDKRFFFRGESMVAYAVVKGVALVSPDPLGPAAERREVWAAFRAFADEHGWPVAVMGAGTDWLPMYRASGMRDLYVGDEAVVDVRRFDLAGGRNKGLRQAVNRVAKRGYRTEFHDPARVPEELEVKLRRLMAGSRRGEVERGFSMTLGRIFEPEDEGLLLAVCFGPDDEPVALCQYVPAPAVDGYSLDLMRRSEGEHPNGLTDFLVVETIAHLRSLGRVGLGLNFSVMRGVLAGERGDTSFTRLQGWFLGRMGDGMQIESLWRFNAKFDPDWEPRYAVYDAPEHFLTAALAVAEAESFWELPVIGRFFRPAATPAALPAAPDSHGSADPEPVVAFADGDDPPHLAPVADDPATPDVPPTPGQVA